MTEQVRRLNRGSWIVALIGGFVWATATLFHAGVILGFGQTDYLVVADSPDKVVLRAYGDRLVGARFDAEKKIVYPEFSLLQAGEDPTLILARKRIGPLTTSRMSRALAPTPATDPGTGPTTALWKP
jgi:hypothetical protein